MEQQNHAKHTSNNIQKGLNLQKQLIIHTKELHTLYKPIILPHTKFPYIIQKKRKKGDYNNRN